MKHLSQEDFSQIPVKGLVPESGATPPASPTFGQLWTDTSVTPKVVKFYNGTSWIRIDGSDLPDESVTNAKIASNANITLSKLATDPLARANHTGTQAASTISDLAAVVKAYRLDEFALPANPLNLNGQRGVNAGTPQADTDVATKRYVDDARAGISVKDPVRVVATSNVNVSAPGSAIDGINLPLNARVLLTAQTAGTENGLYQWNGAATAMTRTTDADAAGEVVDGTLVAVADGSHAGEQWIQTAEASGNPGTWTQEWTQFSAGGQTYSAGNGLNLAANVFSVVAADGSVAVSGSGVAVGLVPIDKGGTGATTASGARTAIGAVGQYVGLLPALTAGTWTEVTHNLNNLHPHEPAFEEVASKEFVRLDSRKTANPNTIEVRSDVAVSANTIRISVIG